MMGDTMESEHNQICECPLLDELEMPNASLQDGTHSRNRWNLNEQESSQESEMIFLKFTFWAN